MNQPDVQPYTNTNEYVTTIVEVALILIAAISFGMIANFVAGQPLQPLRPLLSVRDSDVSLPEMIRLHRNDALVFDTRPPKEYGKGHIPGARNFPIDDFDTDLEGIKTLIAGRTNVIVYCDTKCGSAAFFGMLLANEGVENPRLFRLGISGWRRAGLEITVGEQP